MGKKSEGKNGGLDRGSESGSGEGLVEHDGKCEWHKWLISKCVAGHLERDEVEWLINWEKGRPGWREICGCRIRLMGNWAFVQVQDRMRIWRQRWPVFLKEGLIRKQEVEMNEKIASNVIDARERFQNR